MKNNKLVALSIASILVTSSTAAIAEDDSNCGSLSLMISNNTTETCQLIQKDVKYGKISSSTQVPVLISPGNSSFPFEMQQLFYGPAIVLTYQCGNDHTITFESQQDYCFFSAGNINATVYSAQSMSAKYQKDTGSSFWDRHGTINWTLYF